MPPNYDAQPALHIPSLVPASVFRQVLRGEKLDEILYLKHRVWFFSSLLATLDNIHTVAAIHGGALGGGFQIAMGADIRFCIPDAKFSIMEMKWGLIPDMSVTQTIRDLVSIDVVKELVFTGKVVKGEEAARLKLVTHVCEKPYDEAMVLAKEIASKNPDAVRAAKKLLNEVWHGDSSRGSIMESELMMTVMGTPNQVEAISANFSGRPPTFKDTV